MFIQKSSTEEKVDFSKLAADGVHYINTSQWLLAYSAFAYLTRHTKSKTVDLLYNMALCHFSAKEYAKAVAMLGEAQMKIATPSVLQNATNNLPNNLLTDEYDNSYYRLALKETASELNTNLVKLRIRRLLVDVNLLLENWQEVIRLSVLPDMDKCKNVREALAIVKSN